MPDTVYACFAEVAKKFADRTALMRKVEGKYQGIGYADLSRTVDELAAGLAERGVRPGSMVGIYSYNRPEWVATDLAVAKLGAILIPVYHTLGADAIRYILNDAGVTHLIVESPELLANITRILPEVAPLQDVVTVYGQKSKSQAGKQLLNFDELRKSGAEALKQNPKLADPHKPEPDDLFTVCYTSGTTGEPKGAMLTHRNILSNVQALIPLFGINENDVLVSFLPLCHMFERTGGYYCVLMAGGSIAYAESVQTIREDVQLARPTVMIVVPRVLEKVYNAVREKVESGSALRRALMVSTLRTYSRYARLRAGGHPLSLWLRFRHWLLGRLVVRKLTALGGGRLRLLVSGSAPLDRRLARIVRNLGFNLLEGYGLTETSPAASIAVPGQERVGTVGKPLKGVEVRIGPNDEILIRGPNVMKGYLNKPKETAEVIDTEGWFHTGDQGKFDAEGNLIITGRIKELIVSSYGKNIAPIAIEQAIAQSKYVEQVMVYGDKRPFLTALVVPSPLALEGFARERGIACKRYTDVLDHPEVLKLYDKEIKEALAGFAQYEQVHRFWLVPDPLTVENGLLTPSLKMRRPQVVAAFRGQIEKMYEGH
ncbi:long-chain fatty acid--CoA ligase [candidate division WOR-3 bacterium]|uniref:Long-chain fatty acid--CoA ligase n=1 Tax=candidate division WOR-3 bacterium TaxID=2052148 RepID=A0A937XG92_UNCW3|nr:long-chain fatty acid--CoA ligase [candidate division WOR-3 bacterium]